ncbi:MAG TPA: hypothetical protein VF595_10510 [Tepidisphaeraceae bacterium]
MAFIDREKAIGRNGNGHGISLSAAATLFGQASWPTPNASDNRNTAGGRGPGANPTLRIAIKTFASPPASARPTPAARDSKGPNGPEHFESRERPHLDQLSNAAALWATPNTSRRGAERLDRLRSRLAGKAGGRELAPEAIAWATPNATASRRGMTMPLNGVGRARGEPKELNYQIGSFPCIRPHGEPIWRRLRKRLAKLDRPTRAETFRLLRVVWRAESGGIGRLSRLWTRPKCPRLNPKFRMWLMGIPFRHRICCVYPATVLLKTQPSEPSSCCGEKSSEAQHDAA